MPKLIIIRGNSGSGKTTVAKVLQQKFGRNTMLLSHDMVRREILNVPFGNMVPIYLHIIMICLLRKPCAAMKPNPIGMISEKVICAAGGRKRIL